MPLTTSSMTPEPKKTTGPTKPAETTPAKLAPAGESGSPAVHRLLAQRQAAVLNNDQDAITAIDKELRKEHGVSAG